VCVCEREKESEKSENRFFFWEGVVVPFVVRKQRIVLFFFG
jgi:hypothetical protein